MKVVVILNGLQSGYSKFMCFFCAWNSRPKSEHYTRRTWSPRETFELGSPNVIREPLVEKEKIILSNFVMLDDGVFGNYANKVESSYLYQVRKLNYELMNSAIEYKNLFLVDAEQLSSIKGKSNVFNPRLYVHADIIYENSDFIFHGTSDVCYSYTNSRGSIDFKDFQVKHMVFAYAAVRDATINVTERLESQVYHTGNLYYKGNPMYVNTHSYSSGKIIQLITC